MINPWCIEVFLALVEHKTISAVAKIFHFSQPTISEYLNQLEKMVGTTLVLRGKGYRQIALTPAGKAFLPLAQRWMKYQKEIETEIKQFSQTQPHNGLRLAASSGAHQLLVSNIIYKLMARHPDINLRLCNVERREMLSAIENYDFDIAFIFADAPESDLVTVIPLFAEQRYILCPADTELPNRIITPEELDRNYEITYVQQNKSKEFQSWYQSCFPETKTPKFEVSSLASAHKYLTHPNSWAIVPASVAISNVSQQADKLTFRRIEPEPPQRICSILISKSYGEAKVIREFLQCCEEYISDQTYMQKIIDVNIDFFKITK